MARRALSGPLVLLGLGACGAAPAPAGAPAAEDRAEVIAAVESLFAGMRSRDLEMLAEVLLPTASIFRIDVESGETETATVADLLAAVETAPEPLNEAMWEPEVRVDGPLAMLWAPYGFHRGATFSHWGYDAFHLVREGESWRIVAIAYTRRFEPMRVRTGR